MLKQALVALGAVALVGCGGGDPLGEADAQLAWQATQGAMGGQGATPGGITSTVQCAEGGKMKVKYDLFGGLSATGNEVDIEYTLVFRGCKHDGVKISGKMVYTITANTGADGASTRWGYEGELRYAGDISGSCEYSMFGEATANAAGASVSYSGSICGHDAGLTLNVSSTGTEVEVTNNLDQPIDGEI